MPWSSTDFPAENIATVNADAGLTTTELLYADGSDTTEEYAICVQKGNTELLEAINATLQRLIDEGKIDEFFGKPHRCRCRGIMG